MLPLLVVVIVVCIVCVVAVIAHVRPLTVREIGQLAEARRQRTIASYFDFAIGEVQVDSEFKRRLNPNGCFYEVDTELAEWPQIAAALLKYKKHEWIIVAFERDRRVLLLWVNKGPNRESVALLLSISEVADIATRNRCTSVLIFHNHPNPAPGRINCAEPSNPDLATAQEWGCELVASGLNALEFICERGIHYPYFAAQADSFMPRQFFVQQLNSANDVTWSTNLALHCERVLSISWQPPSTTIDAYVHNAKHRIHQTLGSQLPKDQKTWNEEPGNSAACAATLSPNHPVETDQVTQQIQVVPVVSIPFEENAYVARVEGQAKCVVIDPGFEPEKIIAHLDDNGLVPAAILNTHGHSDHIAGNAALKGRWPDCPLVIGAADADKLTDPAKNLSAAFGAGLVSPPADVEVNDMKTYSAAGIDLLVRAIPGHTAGHVVFIWGNSEAKRVFVGDVIFAGSIGRTDFPDGDHAQLISGIRDILFALPDQTELLPGHGPSTTVGQEKRHNPFVGERASG